MQNTRSTKHSCRIHSCRVNNVGYVTVRHRPVSIDGVKIYDRNCARLKGENNLTVQSGQDSNSSFSFKRERARHKGEKNDP